MVDRPRAESRLWPIVAIIAVVALLAFLPNRYALLPTWFGYVLGSALVISMILAWKSANRIWVNVERVVVWLFVLMTTAVDLIVLNDLIADIIFHRKAVSPITLLATAVAIWIANVLVFAFVYWQIDRGGPEGRARGWSGRADLTFPQGNPADGVPEDWRPVFADYLFVGFNTSTAFSPTDTLPLTVRAKMLMMTQSAISLVTIVIVAARAINILT